MQKHYVLQVRARGTHDWFTLATTNGHDGTSLLGRQRSHVAALKYLKSTYDAWFRRAPHYLPPNCEHRVIYASVYAGKHSSYHDLSGREVTYVHQS